MKIKLEILFLIFCTSLIPSCMRHLPQGYLGAAIVSAEVYQKSYSSFEVLLNRQDSPIAADNVRSTLERLGIKFEEKEKSVEFHCSRAALIGFLATVSENGTATAPLGTHEIVCGRIGFPVKAHGGITIVAADSQ